ncbi:MAG: hypothetical protein CME88_16615 [Hirschia sp.]|nr:hypothetical protein [Hirschia sp.]MBF20000.1 hypothetical protein [Hirschia sp.]
MGADHDATLEICLDILASICLFLAGLCTNANRLDDPIADPGRILIMRRLVQFTSRKGLWEHVTISRDPLAA